MDPQKLFRKTALEKLSSPEQLDVMMRVTSPASWLALIGIGATLAAIIVWGIVGSIPIKVHGKGILMRGQAVLDVTADGNGRLSEILVRPGENVQDGHLIARLDLPDEAPVINKMVKDIQLPPDSVLVSIVRGEEVIVPHGETMLESGDDIVALTMVGNESKLLELLVGKI